MGVIFGGRKFAAEIETRIKEKATGWKRKPKLVSVYDPNDTGSRIYTAVKEEKARELGIDFEKIQIANYTNSQIKLKIRDLSADPGVDGIMVQLPLAGSEELVNLIDKSKDVDGLREDSPFLPATVRAVAEILKFAGGGYKDVLVVGSQGEVGRRLVDRLNCRGMDKEDFDAEKLKNVGVVISCTGQAGIIRPEMVKPGVVVIDVGYPKGDFDPAVAAKAGFFTPVPGGVGPVTVAMLFANLVKLDLGEVKYS